MKFEVCVDNIQSVQTASQAEVDRVELCSALSVGGLTPSYGFLKQAIGYENLSHHVMIRPRSGNFIYNDEEIEQMLFDIQMAKNLGADGVVFGVLDASGHIDKEKCKILLQAAQGMQATFHRAFDLCSDHRQALEDIIKLGFQRILTSGQHKTALDGKHIIKDLVTQSNGRIEIMAGSGITSENVLEIVRTTNVSDVHFSAKKVMQLTACNNGVAMGSDSDADNQLAQADINEILKIKQELEQKI